jgi:hypothetical protein
MVNKVGSMVNLVGCIGKSLKSRLHDHEVAVSKVSYSTRARNAFVRKLYFLFSRRHDQHMMSHCDITQGEFIQVSILTVSTSHG